MAQINRITNWKNIAKAMPDIDELSITDVGGETPLHTNTGMTYSYELSLFAFKRYWDVYLVLTEQDSYVTIIESTFSHEAFADSIDVKILSEPRNFIFFILNKIAAWIHENK